MSDPLLRDWNGHSSKDDWGVHSIYLNACLDIVANELLRQSDEMERRAGSLEPGTELNRVAWMDIAQLRIRAHYILEGL